MEVVAELLMTTITTTRVMVVKIPMDFLMENGTGLEEEAEPLAAKHLQWLPVGVETFVVLGLVLEELVLVEAESYMKIIEGVLVLVEEER